MRLVCSQWWELDEPGENGDFGKWYQATLGEPSTLRGDADGWFRTSYHGYGPEDQEDIFLAIRPNATCAVYREDGEELGSGREFRIEQGLIISALHMLRSSTDSTSEHVELRQSKVQLEQSVSTLETQVKDLQRELAEAREQMQHREEVEYEVVAELMDDDNFEDASREASTGASRAEERQREQVHDASLEARRVLLQQGGRGSRARSAPERLGPTEDPRVRPMWYRNQLAREMQAVEEEEEVWGNNGAGDGGNASSGGGDDDDSGDDDHDDESWKGRSTRAFTRAEDLALLQMRAAGKGPTEIGRSLGRRESSVRFRLQRLIEQPMREKSVEMKGGKGREMEVEGEVTEEGEVWLAQLGVGSKLSARDTRELWCPATVVSCRGEGAQRKLLVHYKGWKARWDEWLSLGSGRIRPFDELAPLQVDEVQESNPSEDGGGGGVDVEGGEAGGVVNQNGPRMLSRQHLRERRSHFTEQERESFEVKLPRLMVESGWSVTSTSDDGHYLYAFEGAESADVPVFSSRLAALKWWRGQEVVTGGANNGGGDNDDVEDEAEEEEEVEEVEEANAQWEGEEQQDHDGLRMLSRQRLRLRQKRFKKQQLQGFETKLPRLMVESGWSVTSTSDDGHYLYAFEGAESADVPVFSSRLAALKWWRGQEVVTGDVRDDEEGQQVERVEGEQAVSASTTGVKDEKWEARATAQAAPPPIVSTEPVVPSVPLPPVTEPSTVPPSLHDRVRVQWMTGLSAGVYEGVTTDVRQVLGHNHQLDYEIQVLATYLAPLLDLSHPAMPHPIVFALHSISLDPTYPNLICVFSQSYPCSILESSRWLTMMVSGRAIGSGAPSFAG